MTFPKRHEKTIIIVTFSFWGECFWKVGWLIEIQCLLSNVCRTGNWRQLMTAKRRPRHGRGSQIIWLKFEKTAKILGLALCFTDLVFNSCTTSERLEGHLVSHTTFIYQVLKSDQFSPESDNLPPIDNIILSQNWSFSLLQNTQAVISACLSFETQFWVK